MPRTTPLDTAKARPGDRAVRLFLPEPDHDRLRILAARRKTSMAELARAVVTEALDREDRRNQR